MKEEGYSLVEITVAVVLMTLLLAVSIPPIYNATLQTTAKTALKTDLTAVGVVLAYTYDTVPPTVEEFNNIKETVLVDYYSDTAEQKTVDYLDSIQYFYNDGFYCVEGEKTHSNTVYVMNYNTVTNSIVEETCFSFFNNLD